MEMLERLRMASPMSKVDFPVRTNSVGFVAFERLSHRFALAP